MSVTEENAYEHAERIYEAYKDRIIAKLNEVKAEFAANLWDYTAPFDLSGDDYEWTMLVAPHGESAKGPKSFAISFHVHEALGFGDGPDGINFGINVVYHGGNIVGGITPYNYTDECWVSMLDDEAVEDRFSIVENAPALDIYNLCADYTPST